jgi:hypothetical protein
MYSSPQPQFTNRGIPSGHNIPYGYVNYPPGLMPPQQGIATQPHAMMTAPIVPFGGIIKHAWLYLYIRAHLTVSLIPLPTLYTGVGYPPFSQDTGSATGAPSMPQSVSYQPAQVQHTAPFGVHSGWSVLTCS